MKAYSVVAPSEFHKTLVNHLIRTDDQEDLCFATYVPSTGEHRFSGIIADIIMPHSDERVVHGNVGFMPQYLERVLQIATERKQGIALLHSHLGPGLQDMSNDDFIAEQRIAPSVYAITQLPLLGMTAGNDGSWSARYWLKDKTIKRKYNRTWCESVRVVGKDLRVTFNDNLLPARFDIGKQLRTISAWGKKAQEDLSRLKIGIVGLGSVGSIVAEILSRTGISHFRLIDFDSVELKNLDRLTNVFKSDVGKSKVRVIADRIVKGGTSPTIKVNSCEYSICEEKGFNAALDCDLLFSCVDRPWPREVLNFIAYAHLIPVIDGGILVRTNTKNTNIVGADWKAHTVGHHRACLECLGQYKSENASLERSGLLDDPSYVQSMPNASIVNAHENVFVFSSHLASLEVLQMLSLVLAPSGINDVGQQMYHFVTGTQDSSKRNQCNASCFFPSIVGKGDHTGVIPYGEHQIAFSERQKRGFKKQV